MNRAPDLRDGFTLALGGGGGRGWAHLGVARALDAFGLEPTRIVGTSMGAIIGAALAAGRRPGEIEERGRRMSLYRHVRRGRLSLFDPRPLLERLATDLGDPNIEELPVPLGISTFDLVSGQPRLITSGRLVDALEMSIAVPLFFPPLRNADGIWCDAGPWEGVPVSLARTWAPGDPVVGVLVDIPKPAFLASPLSAAFLRATASRLGTATPAERLTARRYLGLLAARWADPVVVDPPDLLIAPRLGFTNALQFGRVVPAAAIGERDARLALAGIGLVEASDRVEASDHAA
jgi:predicted acylesterase/phospholipase RssA